MKHTLTAAVALLAFAAAPAMAQRNVPIGNGVVHASVLPAPQCNNKMRPPEQTYGLVSQLHGDEDGAMDPFTGTPLAGSLYFAAFGSANVPSGWLWQNTSSNNDIEMVVGADSLKVTTHYVFEDASGHYVADFTGQDLSAKGFSAGQFLLFHAKPPYHWSWMGVTNIGGATEIANIHYPNPLGPKCP